MSNLTPPRNDAAEVSGSGFLGLNFAPSDREFAKARSKAQAVLDGQQAFTFDELCKIVARLVISGA